MQYNKNKLNVQSQNTADNSGWSVGVIVGVVLILLAAGLFGLLFISKGNNDSSKSESAEVGNAKTSDSSQLKVHFIDVGQGDCTLVVSKGEAMLIDSGEADSNDKVIKYLKDQGITKLKYIIVTHPHTDHMGEMPDILKAVKTENFIMPKVPDDLTPTIKKYENMLKQIKAQGLGITWSSNTRFNLGDAVIDTYIPKGKFKDLNNYSTVVKVSCGDRKFLITGDTEKEEEADLISQKFDLKADVLKVPHHGSYKGTTEGLLEAVGAKYAVISCAKDNEYGHPHDKTLKRMKKYISEIYMTKDNANIVFSTDGSELWVIKQRG